MSRYERWALGVSIATLIAISAAGTIYYRQLTTMQGATEAATRSADAVAAQGAIMRAQLEMTERPWVSADISAITPFTFDADGGHVTLRFLLKNTGHTPAAKTQLRARMFAYLDTFASGGRIQQQAELCDPLRTLPPDATVMHDTVFPGAPVSEKYPLNMKPQEIEAAMAKHGWVWAWIVGCIDYQFEFAAGHHQTGFAFSISAPDPAEPGKFVPLRPVPAEYLNVELLPFPYSGSDAD